MKLVLGGQSSPGEENKIIKKKRREREREREEKKKAKIEESAEGRGWKREKNIYESFAFLFAPGKNIKFQCTASQKHGIRRTRFRSL